MLTGQGCSVTRQQQHLGYFCAEWNRMRCGNLFWKLFRCTHIPSLIAWLFRLAEKLGFLYPVPKTVRVEKFNNQHREHDAHGDSTLARKIGTPFQKQLSGNKAGKEKKKSSTFLSTKTKEGGRQSKTLIQRNPNNISLLLFHQGQGSLWGANHRLWLDVWLWWSRINSRQSKASNGSLKC